MNDWGVAALNEFIPIRMIDCCLFEWLIATRKGMDTWLLFRMNDLLLPGKEWIPVLDCYLEWMIDCYLEWIISSWNRRNDWLLYRMHDWLLSEIGVPGAWDRIINHETRLFGLNAFYFKYCICIFGFWVLQYLQFALPF